VLVVNIAQEGFNQGATMSWWQVPTIETWPWDGGDVVAIDFLVLAMSVVSIYHAVVHSRATLLLASLALGALTEFGSIRCGGTHCHNAGLLNVAYCSSANSVIYYMPWIYSCVVSADRLVGRSRWALPWLTGVLTFGMCGVYEMQGPNMRWWKWPVVPGHASGKGGWLVRFDDAQLTGLDAFSGNFWQLEPKQGHIISEHAADALKERVFDVSQPIERPALPVMAPYFDMAFGWGVGLMLWLAPGLGEAPCVLLGAGAALLWDLPVRWLRHLGFNQIATVPVLMGLAAAVPLMLLPSGLVRRPATSEPDWPLFFIQLANAGFFVYNALTAGLTSDGTPIIPPALAMLVLAVASISLLLPALAAGVIGRPSKPSTLSFLDRLQKDAHASEMDHSNTHPMVFVGLTMIQPPIVALLADLCGLPRAIGLLPIATHACMFVVSHYLLGTDKFFDITGEATLLPLILYSHKLQCPEATPRQMLTTAVALVWVTRLGLFLGMRIFVRGSDWRFEKLMDGAAYNAFGWICQGTWIFLTGMCVWLCHAAAATAPLGILDYLGAAIALSGVAISHVADLQKSKFNANTKSGMQKTWIQTGLWAWSRHPNYFGEIVAWVGMAMLCMGGVDTLWAALLCWESPLFSGAFLLFTSLMLLEKRIDAKFGGQPKYEQYKRTTSVLILWPPKGH
jgi:steroid 5-alpha reductase family enzyme